MEKIVFEMIIDKDSDGVYAMSLVDQPAIELDYILLNEETPRIEIKLEKANINHREHIITGPALIPDTEIPRNGGYFIKFASETIKQISEKYLIGGSKDEVTIQHIDKRIKNIYLVESWIVNDPKNDKANALGYTNLKAGTWMISMKIMDENIWNNYLETGILKGFSLEGKFTPIRLSKDNDLERSYLYDIYMAFNFTENDLKSKYIWKMGAGDNICPACKKFSGQIKTLEDWANTAIPRMKTGEQIGSTSLSTNFNWEFSTYCKDACRCQLVRVTESKYNVKVIKPW